MTRYPVSPRCPGCGSEKSKRFHDDKAPTLRALRECKDCGSRYEPPMPRWALFTALGIGAAILVGGAVSACFVPQGMGQVRVVLVTIALCGLTVMALSVHQLRRGKPGPAPSPERSDRPPAAPNESPSSGAPKPD